MSKAVKRALERRNAAERHLGEVLRKNYPPGKFIRWEWSGQTYSGTVVLNGYIDRIKVLNAWTGKERWIHAYNII